MKINKGFAISLEGGEGAGKSTLMPLLSEYLKNKGFEVLCTREPGGVRVSELIRDILLNDEYQEVDRRTEALLFAAARRQHLVEKVLPALAQGKIVLIDRFVDSSLVYQGVSRGIGIEEVWQINRFAIEDFMPRLTLLLDVEPSVSLKRQSESDKGTDKLDKLPLSFHERVRMAYLELHSSYPERIKRIDAGQEIDLVLRDCIAQLEQILIG